MTESLGTYSGVDVDLDLLDAYGWRDPVSVAGTAWPRFLGYLEAMMLANGKPTAEADLVGTSSTSFALSNGVSRTFTTQAGKAWRVGQSVVVYGTAQITTAGRAIVTAYDSATGSMTVAFQTTIGGATLASWTISG